MKYLAVLLFFLSINSAGAISEFWFDIGEFLDEAKVADFINQLTTTQRYLLIAVYLLVVGTVINIIYNFIASLNLIGLGISVFVIYLFWEDILWFFLTSFLLFNLK